MTWPRGWTSVELDRATEESSGLDSELVILPDGGLAIRAHRRERTKFMPLEWLGLMPPPAPTGGHRPEEGVGEY